MIRKYGYHSLEEAEEAARELLRSNRRADFCKGGEYTLQRTAIRYKGDEDYSDYYYTEIDPTTGREGRKCFIIPPVCVFPDREPNYNLACYSAEERDPVNRTYPFRLLQDKYMHAITRVGVIFYKPTLPLSPQEAQTDRGQTAIAEFIGTGDFKEDVYEPITKETLLAAQGKREAFFAVEDEEIEANPDDEEWGKYWEDNIRMELYPPLPVLSEATGINVSSLSDFTKAIAKLVGSPLNKREKRAIKSAYTAQGIALLEYAAYEFFRTEKYSRLQEALSHFADFGLQKNWERDFFMLQPHPTFRDRGQASYTSRCTPEEWVIAKYIGRDYSTLIGTPSYREVAEATGIPLNVIYKAAKRTIWD